MAAPSNTKWGSIVGGYGRIGISVTLTNTSNTETKRHTEIWFWSKYTVNDSSNTFYYDDQATSATTSKGSVSVKTTVSSGSGWSTTNQVKLKEYDYTWTRGTSASTKHVAAKLTGIERVGGTMTCSTSYTIPAKPSYTVKYNPNGGSGAPGNQTKWYGTTLKLSTAKPTRTGYTFKGWATSASGSVVYASGANYTANAAVTLYAVWSINTYTISYNPNGGSGAPGNQTKNYGATLTLSTTKPTRSNYTFKGWATSSTGAVAYASGASYTSNASVTLYAVWELAYVPPTITNLKAQRCSSAGTANELGTYAKVTFSWSCSQLAGANAVKSVVITWGTSGKATVTTSGINGTVSTVIGAGAFSVETTYTITATITDSKGGSTSKDTTLPTTKFAIDFKSGGTGVAIGKVADTANLFDVALRTVFRTGTDSAIATASSGYVLIGNPASQHISIDNNEIMSKANGTAGGDLHLQAEGGNLYLGTNMVQVGYNRFSNGVLGFFHNATDAKNNTNRVGYIGPPDASNIDIYINNEVGGWVYVNTNFRCLSNIRTAGKFVFDVSSSTYAQLCCNWKDGSLHDMVNRTDDGLTMYLGPVSLGSSYKTVTNIRGYTVRLYNHGGGTYLGSSGSTAVTSDRNLKRDIYDINDQYVEFFMKLRPVSYKYNAKENVGHRDHLGYIAQEVEEALTDSGLTTEQFAGICIETDVDFNMNDEGGMTEEERAAENIHYDKLYSLRYEEFIALNTHMIQKALNVIDEQQMKINELETRIAKLEKILEKQVSE